MFKKFDPLAYILNLEDGNIGNTLLFFCRYERRYADQFVLQHLDKIAQLISEQYRVGDNLLARVLMTGYSISIILNSLTPEQATAAILHTNNNGRNALMVACRKLPPLPSPPCYDTWLTTPLWLFWLRIRTAGIR